MSKITNDGLTRSGTECFVAITIWQQWASKGYYKICHHNIFVSILIFTAEDIAYVVGI